MTQPLSAANRLSMEVAAATKTDLRRSQNVRHDACKSRLSNAVSTAIRASFACRESFSDSPFCLQNCIVCTEWNIKPDLADDADVGLLKQTSSCRETFSSLFGF